MSAREAAENTRRKSGGWQRHALLVAWLSGALCPTPSSSLWNRAQAQVVGPVITGPGEAELKRITKLLDNAKTLDQQLAALGEAQKVLNAVAQLPTNALASRTKVATKAYVRVAMKVLEAMTLVCESGRSKKISLQAKQFLSTLVRDRNAFLDQSAVKKLKTRLDRCLGPVKEYEGTVEYTFKTPESLIRSKTTVIWILQNDAR